MTAEDRSRDVTQPLDTLHENERIKADSSYLRGTIIDGLADRISERRQQKLEPAYQFMVRVRLPAGVCRTDQWLTLDRLAREYGNQTLRLTTRQTFQFHGILKNNIKTTTQGINDALLVTPMIRHYARSREAGEPFGDFVIRAGYVSAVHKGREFNS